MFQAPVQSSQGQALPGRGTSYCFSGAELPSLSAGRPFLFGTRLPRVRASPRLCRPRVSRFLLPSACTRGCLESGPHGSRELRCAAALGGMPGQAGSASLRAAVPWAGQAPQALVLSAGAWAFPRLLGSGEAPGEAFPGWVARSHFLPGWLFLTPLSHSSCRECLQLPFPARNAAACFCSLFVHTSVTPLLEFKA